MGAAVADFYSYCVRQKKITHIILLQCNHIEAKKSKRKTDPFCGRTAAIASTAAKTNQTEKMEVKIQKELNDSVEGILQEIVSISYAIICCRFAFYLAL